MSLLFTARVGDESKVTIPSDITGLTANVSKGHRHIVVNLDGLHSGDGRLSAPRYRVSVMQVRRDYDADELPDPDDVDYLWIEEAGNNTVAIVALTEVSA